MRRIGYILGILSGLFWGITSILYGFSNISESISILIVFFVDFLGLILSVFYFFFKENKLKIHLRGILFCSVSGIFGGPIGMLFYLKAIESIGSVASSSISIIYPIFGSIFSFFLSKEKITKISLLGLVIAISCIIVFTNTGKDNDLFKQLNFLGICFALITAISWGGEIISSSYAMKYYDGITVYFFRQLFSSIGYILFIITNINLNNIDLTNFPYKIIISIIFSSILSYFLYYQTIYFIEPLKAMALNITYGIWVIILSILFLDLYLDFKIIFLGIGILLGTSLTILDKK